MTTWKDVRASMEAGESLNPVPTGMELVPVVGLTFVAEYPNNILTLQKGIFSEIRVRLVRDPENAYDPNAIRVYADGSFIGHVPRDTAARLAPQMDSFVDFEAFVYGIRVSPENPLNPGIDLVVGMKG